MSGTMQLSSSPAKDLLARTESFFERVSGPTKEYEATSQETLVVHAMGLGILHDPWYNKGTAFPSSERERLGLRGLLAPRIETMVVQEERFMAEFSGGVTIIAPEEMEQGGVTSEMARKWISLQTLKDRNETLFYKVLTNNFKTMAPIVYTPTVGWVCTNMHKLLSSRSRGMYFSAADKGEMAAMAYNWPADVHAIVVTDGSRILGLGDLGANGMGIPIGKLDLYSAAAGFSPARVLPVMLDVGTNNSNLRNDPMYLGLKQPRLDGEEYIEIVDEFVRAVMGRWPQAVLQFEDFSTDHALLLLDRYRHHHLVFNDDIQGTAATAVAGLYGAMRASRQPISAIAQQRIVCVGVGSAGMGVVNMIAAAIAKHGNMSTEQARRHFWMLNSKGLITRARPGLAPYVIPFARPQGEGAEAGREGDSLLEVVKTVKPTVLLGLAGAGRLFTPEVLQAMAEHCEQPIVFPMSNPTSKMECTAQQAYDYTEGRCLFASGSPQPPPIYKGKPKAVSQANNLFVFPGLALGAFLGKTGVVLDPMIEAAAETLPSFITAEELEAGQVYPDLKNIRNISATIAAEVIKAAARHGLEIDPGAAQALAKGDKELIRWVMRRMYVPEYRSLAYLPPGIGE